MALDVGFEVTPSNSLEGQIEVASSNDLGGRGLKRPRRSRPQTTSSGSLKYEEVIILQTGYRTINGYFRSDNGRYKQYQDTSGLLPVTPRPIAAISGHFRSTSGNIIAYRGHIRSLPVKFRYLLTSRSFLRPLPVCDLGRPQRSLRSTI